VRHARRWRRESLQQRILRSTAGTGATAETLGGEGREPPASAISGLGRRMGEGLGWGAGTTWRSGRTCIEPGTTMAGCLRSRGWGEIRGRRRGTAVAGRDPRLGAYTVVGATYMGGGGRGSCAAKPSTAPSPPAPRSGLLALGAHRATVCRRSGRRPVGGLPT
jgi:hypothetical protein